MSKLVKDQLIIELQYLPSIAWFQMLNAYPVIYLDKHEHFVKASYRNRCHLLGPNGIARLSVPIAHGKDQHKAMGEILISNTQPWQKIHWMTICSCYRRSAYFEYFEDAFYPFYHQPYNSLFDYNFELLQLLLKILKIEKDIRVTDTYISPGNGMMDDKRSQIMPNHPAIGIKPIPPYTQVFSDRFEFIPNLSIIDCIFNQGNKFNL